MANDTKNPETPAAKTKGRKKTWGEWDQNGVRTRSVVTYARLDQANKDSRKDNPDNFEKITYTETNFRNVDAAKNSLGKNFLAVVNAGVSAQAKRDAVSIVSSARKIAALTGGTIQEEMEVLKARIASKTKGK